MAGKTRQDGTFLVFSRSVIFGRKAAAPHHGGDSPHPTPMVKLDYSCSSARSSFYRILPYWHPGNKASTMPFVQAHMGMPCQVAREQMVLFH